NIVGHELIFEQLLPYLDYYQARANAGMMGWMEHDRIKAVLNAGTAQKIPLFDYVYSGYGARRMDGYAYADASQGGMYYHSMAVTALNGGIPEYNFEFLDFADYMTLEETDREMLRYIDELSTMRTTYGKRYLTYGTQVRAPEVGAGTVSYHF